MLIHKITAPVQGVVCLFSVGLLLACQRESTSPAAETTGITFEDSTFDADKQIYVMPFACYYADRKTTDSIDTPGGFEFYVPRFRFHPGLEHAMHVFKDDAFAKTLLLKFEPVPQTPLQRLETWTWRGQDQESGRVTVRVNIKTLKMEIEGFGRTVAGTCGRNQNFGTVEDKGAFGFSSNRAGLLTRIPVKVKAFARNLDMTCVLGALDDELKCWEVSAAWDALPPPRGLKLKNITASASAFCGIAFDDSIKCWDSSPIFAPESTRGRLKSKIARLSEVVPNALKVKDVKLALGGTSLCYVSISGSVGCLGSSLDDRETTIIDVEAKFRTLVRAFEGTRMKTIDTSLLKTVPEAGSHAICGLSEQDRFLCAKFPRVHGSAATLEDRGHLFDREKTCGVETDGKLFCPQASDPYLPSPFSAPGHTLPTHVKKFLQIGYYSLCYIGLDDSLDCRMQRSGNDPEESPLSPTRFPLPQIWTGTHFRLKEVWHSGYDGNACGRRMDDTLSCWTMNSAAWLLTMNPKAFQAFQMSPNHSHGQHFPFEGDFNPLPKHPLLQASSTTGTPQDRCVGELKVKPGLRTKLTKTNSDSGGLDPRDVCGLTEGATLCLAQPPGGGGGTSTGKQEVTLAAAVTHCPFASAGAKIWIFPPHYIK